jgi:drug/metabolite transporter (DMT)-like permease
MLTIGAAFYRTRPTARELLGAALSLAGVAVVLARGEWSQLAAVRFVPGNVLMIGAVAAWAFYSWQLARPHPLLSGAARPSWDWAGFPFAQMLFDVVFAGAAALGEAVVAPELSIRWSPAVIAMLAYVAVGPALLGYFAMPDSKLNGLSAKRSIIQQAPCLCVNLFPINALGRPFDGKAVML